MADAAEHARTVLSAIVGDADAHRAGRALDYATDKLIPEYHFPDKVQRVLFELLVKYRHRFGGIMSGAALADLMRGREPGTIALYAETFSLAAQYSPEWHEFLHAVTQLRELAAERATGEALAMGRRIMLTGAKLDDGTELGGHADAREFMRAAFAEAELLSGESDTPEGNAAAEGDEVMAAYAQAKALQAAGKPSGVNFGLPRLDRFLRGLGKGLCLVVAGTTVGKSSLCVQAAWYNAVIERRDVLVFTTEQHRDEVRIKIVARHSRLPQFGLPRGLDAARIRSGWLSDEEEKALEAVLADLKGGGYGELQVVQMPEHCTVSVMTGRAEAIARRRRPDLVVADYLQLFDPDRRGRDSREYENQSGIVKAAHRWAQTAFHGTGVSLISPWQANQGGAQALRGSAGGGFSLDTHMSQTKEAGNTAGTVLALAAPEEDTSRGRSAPLRLSVEKNRDGARGARFDLIADYATCHFADREDAAEGMAGDLGIEA